MNVVVVLRPVFAFWTRIPSAFTFPADSTPSVVENMASPARIHYENYPSFGSPWGI